MNKVYYAERKDADVRPHRRYDLEAAIANLQLGPLAHHVHEVLDRHRAEMPPVEDQDEDDRIWRLAMHRMDLRQYTVAEDATGQAADAETRTPAANGRQYVRLDLQIPDPDLQEMANRTAAEVRLMDARIGLLMWGLRVFAHEDDTTHHPAQWRQKLEEARTVYVEDLDGEERHLGRGRSGLIAAVCIRDHWEEMSGAEQGWCVTVVCSEVEREGDHWDQLARVQRNGMSADRQCAWVLPLLLGKTLDEAQSRRVRQAFVIALTHAINEVRWYAALGVGRHLWSFDAELALRCVNAIAREATLVLKQAKPSGVFAFVLDGY